jgi:hypothetical protein
MGLLGNNAVWTRRWTPRNILTPSSGLEGALKMEAECSSETLVSTY